MFYNTFIYVFLIIGSTFAVGKSVTNHDYYWKQLVFGIVPLDAVYSGIKNNDYLPVYMGQAYIVNPNLRTNSAIVPVQVNFGSLEVDIPIFGVHNTTKTDIKVLCGPNHAAFEWVQTNSKHIFDELINKGVHLVPGGTEDLGITHIGRITYTNETGRIGKVTTFKGYGEAKFHYAQHLTEMVSDIYDVLVYKD